MELPSFDEFKKTLTKEQIKEISGECEFPEDIFSCDIKYPDNINALIVNLCYNSTEQTAAINSRFLAAYHEWLLQQL